MSVINYDLGSEATLIKQDGKLYWFIKRNFGGAEVSIYKAISRLQDIVDRELSPFETMLVLSTPINISNRNPNPDLTVTVDIVSVLVDGATPSNYLRFIRSLSRVVIGYVIRSHDYSANFHDVNGSKGFYDTDGKLIGKFSVTENVQSERALSTPFFDPIDLVGGALADVVRRGARLAIEATEETVARYLAREGTGPVGAMAGPKAAASAFWSAGEITPRALAEAERKAWTATIETRMKALGIPKKNIGIRGIPGESGEAFTAEGVMRGSNVRGRGISVHGSVVEDWAGFPEWNIASIPDRIDAIIAHEWMEFNELTHWETVELVTESKLPISKIAQDLLAAMRKKGLGWKALEDAPRPR